MRDRPADSAITGLGTQVAGSQNRELQVGLRHPALLVETHGEDHGQDVALACETLARCRNRHDRRSRHGRHVPHQSVRVC